MHLFLRNVEYINGLGSFKDPHTVRVKESNGTEVRHNQEVGYWGLIIDTGKFAIYCNIVHLSVLTKKDNSLFIDPHAETASIS